MVDETETVDRSAFCESVLDHTYQPTKADMERDVSVQVSPQRLAQAVLSGGAPRREDS